MWHDPEIRGYTTYTSCPLATNSGTACSCIFRSQHPPSASSSSLLCPSHAFRVSKAEQCLTGRWPGSESSGKATKWRTPRVDRGNEEVTWASGQLRPPSEPFKADWHLFQHLETLRFANKVHAGAITWLNCINWQNFAVKARLQWRRWVGKKEWRISGFKQLMVQKIRTSGHITSTVNKQTPWFESASELYRRLSAKLVPTFLG
jgi:hypothetical protein